MITVAIVAILAAVAYPSYTNYVIRSNRSAAQSYMLELSSLQQRHLLDARSYTDDVDKLKSVPPEVSANYTVTIPLKTGAALPGFTITATPKGNQLARDTACGTLKIDETGAKTPPTSGGGASCW